MKRGYITPNMPNYKYEDGVNYFRLRHYLDLYLRKYPQKMPHIEQYTIHSRNQKRNYVRG